jgi:hypothetical protein
MNLPGSFFFFFFKKKKIKFKINLIIGWFAHHVIPGLSGDGMPTAAGLGLGLAAAGSGPA